MGDEYRVVIKEVKKNNSTRLCGLVIEKKGVSVSPSFYLEPFYQEFQKGKRMWEIEEEILLLYDRFKVEGSDDELDLDFFADYSLVKEKIAYKLVNFERNKELLQEVPYFPYLDLAIVFYCRVLHRSIGVGSIMIKNDHLKYWGITKEELMETARDNTPRLLPCEVKNIREVIGDLIAREIKRKPEREEEERDGVNWRAMWTEEVMNALNTDSLPEKENSLLVLGNKDRIQGACSMIYQGVLQDVADYLDKDIYVLPSSIHEVLLLPDTGSVAVFQLSEMVREVNETQVSEQEVLSEHVYRFDRRRGKLSIAV